MRLRRPLLLLVLLFCGPRLQGAPAATEEFSSARLAGGQGRKVSRVVFEGEALPEAVRGKFAALAGGAFSPGAVRAALIWYHENGGEALVRILARPDPAARRELELVVEVQQRQRVAEILFEGNTTATPAVLLQQIDVKPGAEFDEAQARLSAKKIVEFYSKQGYLASDARFQFDARKRELRFLVSEGEPTLISSITISPLLSVEKKDLRARYEREILDAFGLRAGDRIQRDRVLEGQQAVKDWLRDHDFLMSRDPALEYKVAADGRVALTLEIVYGPRIRYGFRGNHQFSYRELISIVGEVKEVSSGADYLSSVRRRVLDAYKAAGYPNAKISTLVREDSARGIRYVSLIVAEGGKVRVESIELEGIFSMSKEEALREFRSLGSRLVQRDFFHQEGISRAAELLAEKLRSRGFLSAKLEYAKYDFNQDRTRVKVQLLFSEGVQTRVASAEVAGAKSYPAAELLALLGLREGEPFDIFAFEKGIQSLKEKYRELGHLNVQVVNEAGEGIVRYSKDNTQVHVRVEIDEGPAFRVGEIIVRGNKLTHARVVLRELPFISGDLLRSPQLIEAEDNLRKLGIFGQIVIRPIDHPGAEDLKDILIFVEEGTPGTFDIVPGYRNDLGLRLGFELGYNNLGGWNRGATASAVFNRRLQNYYNKEGDNWRQPEFSFSVGFREPYFAEWPVVFTSNFTFIKRQYHSFDADVRRFTTGFRRELSRHLSGFVEYGYEQVIIRNVNRNSAYATDDPERYIGSVTPGLIFDSRATIDGRPDPFNPMRGIYSVNRFETASKLFGSRANVGYYKASSFNSTYLRVYDDVVLALAVNLGWERSNVVNEQIPAYKLFRLGGLGSIRGYDEDGIEVETARLIKGTLTSLNYRGELRVPFSGSFGTAYFLDAGNLFIDRASFDPTQLRSSVGTGLRYNTPVGPVLLDFAWRLQPDPKVGDTCVTAFSTGVGAERSCLQQPTDRYKIHFAIGVF